MKTMEGFRLVLLGALVALAAVMVFQRGDDGQARAQGLVAGGNYQYFATNNGKDCPVLFIVDNSTQRFAYYTQPNNTQNNRFALFVTRKFTNDLQLDDLTAKGNTGFTVREVAKEVR